MSVPLSRSHRSFGAMARVVTMLAEDALRVLGQDGRFEIVIGATRAHWCSRP